MLNLLLAALGTFGFSTFAFPVLRTVRCLAGKEQLLRERISVKRKG